MEKLKKYQLPSWQVNPQSFSFCFCKFLIFESGSGEIHKDPLARSSAFLWARKASPLKVTGLWGRKVLDRGFGFSGITSYNFGEFSLKFDMVVCGSLLEFLSGDLM